MRKKYANYEPASGFALAMEHYAKDTADAMSWATSSGVKVAPMGSEEFKQS